MFGQALMAIAARRGLSPVGAARRNAEIVFDLCDDASVAAAIDRVRPGAVINAAAITDLQVCERDPGLAYRVNGRGAAMLAEHCRRLDAYLVQVSTDHFFTGDAAGKHDERAPVSLVNEYARTKFAGEAFARNCPGSLVIRTNIAGLRGRGHPTFLEWAIEAIHSGREISLFDDYYTSTIDATACGESLFDLMERRPAGMLNLASSEVSDKRTFVTALSRQLGCNDLPVRSASVRELVPRRAESCGLDVACAERALGRPLPDLDQVIRSLIHQAHVAAPAV